MAGFLNWVGQGMVVAIAAVIALRAVPASRPHSRYRILWIAYALVLILPIIPLVTPGPTVDIPALAARAELPAAMVTVPAAWWTSAAVALSVWMAWIAVRAVHLTIGLIAVRRARQRTRPCPIDVVDRLPHWSRLRASGRTARVVLSDDVPFAAVLGCGSPIIALAPALIERLTADELDRTLVHEWAHVQRRDDWAHLAQRLIATIVGWHPAARWLEAQLAFEREAACDAIAVAQTGSAKAYAACLVTIAELPFASGRVLPALAALAPGGLRRRLVRILALPPASPSAHSRTASIAVAASTLMALAFSVANVRAFAAAAAHAAAPAVSSPIPVAIGFGSTAPRPMAVTMARHSVSAAPSRPIDRALQGGPGRLSAPPDAVETISPATGALLFESIIEEERATPIAATPIAPFNVAFAPTSTETPRWTEPIGRAPWSGAADAGVSIGRSSQAAGVATAAFFTRFGKRIARSF